VNNLTRHAVVAASWEDRVVAYDAMLDEVVGRKKEEES